MGGKEAMGDREMLIWLVTKADTAGAVAAVMQEGVAARRRP